MIQTFRSRRLRVRRGLLALLLVGLVAAVVTTLAISARSWEKQASSLPELKDRITTENEIFRTLIQLAGGSIVLVGFFFTWQTIRVSQEGQITDRFNKAIDHLGATTLTVRLGGIYALARIAADSSKDAPTVVEIFSSYLREAASVDSAVVPSDVKAVLTILGTAAWARDTPRDLRGCKFHGLMMEHLDLSRSVLDDAVFADCRLTETCFDGSSMRAVDFSNAYLRDSTFRKCDVTVACFSNASLRGANFTGAAIFGADFTDASLLGANFTDATNAIRQQFEHAISDESTIPPAFKTIKPDKPA